MFFQFGGKLGAYAAARGERRRSGCEITVSLSVGDSVISKVSEHVAFGYLDRCAGLAFFRLKLEELRNAHPDMDMQITEILNMARQYQL